MLASNAHALTIALTASLFAQLTCGTSCRHLVFQSCMIRNLSKSVWTSFWTQNSLDSSSPFYFSFKLMRYPLHFSYQLYCARGKLPLKNRLMNIHPCTAMMAIIQLNKAGHLFQFLTVKRKRATCWPASSSLPFQDFFSRSNNWFNRPIEGKIKFYMVVWRKATGLG